MVGVPGPAVVAVLTRAPSRGGKSRLFAELGRPPDAALLSALFLDTLDGVHLPGTRRVVFVEPADACDEVRAIVPRDVDVRAQAEGSLGERMRDTMASLFDEGASIVVLVGSDVPDIIPARIETAVARLKRDPGALVLGPAHDGGYFLIAATTIPNVFDGIEWGSAAVLEQTQSAARHNGQRVELTAPLHDVDTLEDLRAVIAPRTHAWLTESGLSERSAQTVRATKPMASSAEMNCERLREAFEGRLAIYVEKGIVPVRVTHIRYNVTRRRVSAQVEEVPDPQLASGIFFGHEGHARRWTIESGYLTTFSAHTWSAGYGGWSLYFEPEIISGLRRLATEWPRELHAGQRYERALEFVYDHKTHEQVDRVFSD